MKSAVKNVPSVFLMTDSQVAEEQFLVLIDPARLAQTATCRLWGSALLRAAPDPAPPLASSGFPWECTSQGGGLVREDSGTMQAWT